MIFVGAQIRAAGRTADIKILQEFNRSTIERESAFSNASDDARKEQAFVELLNFLEIYAAALNGGLLPPISRRIVRDSLVNSIAAIQLAPFWSQKFSEAIKTVTTFEELGRFMRDEKEAISAVVNMMTEPSDAPS